MPNETPTVYLVELADEIAKECFAVIHARLTTAGFTRDIDTIPIVADIGLRIATQIVLSAAKDTPAIIGIMKPLMLKYVEDKFRD